MITPELIAFIQQQLSEGKSREVISELLVTHGWNPVDVAAAFDQMRIAVPPTSTPVSADAVVSSDTAPTQGFSEAVKHPSALVAFATVFLAGMISTLVIHYGWISRLSADSQITQLLSRIPNATMIIGILFVGSILAVLVSSGVVYGAARLLTRTSESISQAFVFTGSMYVLGVLVSLALGAGLAWYWVVIPFIGIWALFFWYYYDSSVPGALGATAIQVSVIGALLALGYVGVSRITIPPTAVAPVPTTLSDSVLPALDTETSDTATSSVVAAETDGTESLENTVSPGTTAASTTASSTLTAPRTKDIPDFDHVADALPVGFPLPKEEAVTTAAVLGASTYEGSRYILEYTSTQTSTQLKASIKSAVEKAGYQFSINEKDLAHRVITATQVVRGSVRTMVVDLNQVEKLVAVRVVFSTQ